MSYSISEIVANPPTGSIVAYFGTSDPAGWVICDGTQRTNNSDGRYNTLYTLSIGSGGSGTANYTPPDLRGTFLRGIGTNGSYTYAIGPTSINTNQNMAILNHGHSMSSHSHTIISGGTSTYAFQITGNGTLNDNDDSTNEVNVLNSYFNLTNNTGNMSANTSATTSTMGNTSVQGPSNTYLSNTDTRPFNYGVSWIIKL